MEFELKTGKQGHIYLPKRIRAILGEKIKILPNDTAGVIFPADAKTEQVIASVEAILLILKLKDKPIEA
ncbi:MAG: hypothetical protein NWE94_04525 [Candidatus Bathyarchaeota archaeon]|nr:hypothetical protein [Candidatus Bathyarchaeota archaeon]